MAAAGGSSEGSWSDAASSSSVGFCFLRLHCVVYLLLSCPLVLAAAQSIVPRFVNRDESYFDQCVVTLCLPSFMCARCFLLLFAFGLASCYNTIEERYA